MAPLASALQMGSKERAVYLGHKVLRGVKVCHAVLTPPPPVTCVTILTWAPLYTV